MMADCLELAGFQPHGLADQVECALMDRVDTKYLLSVHQLNQCLAKLAADYTVLEMSGCRRMAYDTLYFDTPGRQFYLDHHNGKLNRIKVRTRHYRATGQTFIEVKLKNNKRRTLKRRTALDGKAPDPQTLRHFVDEQTGLSATRMLPALFVQYYRTTLINRSSRERITLDTDIRFALADGRQLTPLPSVALVELKSFRHHQPSPALEVLKQCHQRPVSFSKYCIGTALLCRGSLKTNRFKPVLAQLNELVEPREHGCYKESSWNPQLMPISLSA